jgi:hypothetical protein
MSILKRVSALPSSAHARNRFCRPANYESQCDEVTDGMSKQVESIPLAYFVDNTDLVILKTTYVYRRTKIQ